MSEVRHLDWTEYDDGVVTLEIKQEDEAVMADIYLMRGEFANSIVNVLMNCSNELFASVLSQLQTRMAAGGRDAA